MTFTESYLRLPELENITVKEARAIWKSCSLENWVPRAMSFLVMIGFPFFSFMILQLDAKMTSFFVLLLSFYLGELVEVILMRPHLRGYMQSRNASH